MDLIAKSKELRENPEYSGPIWDLERLETMYEMEVEITRLKEQLARTERERDQATRDMGIEDSYYIVQYSKKTGYAVLVGNKDSDPELYAHLDRKVKG